jgi:Beta-propeller repeat
MRCFGLALFLLLYQFTVAVAAPGIAMPIAFEPNLGQADSQVQFIARTNTYTLFLTGSEVLFVPHLTEVDDVVRLQFVNSNPHPAIEGLDSQTGRVSYFVSADPSRWRSNIPLYGKVRINELYPGIDAVFYTREQQLEYDFVIKANADPKRIQLHFDGASIALNSAGDLVLGNKAGELIHHRPTVHQVVNGMRQSVDSEFSVSAKGDVAFKLGKMRADTPVVIDPVIYYSSYLGGSNNDYGLKIRVDRDGSIYVMGVTNSFDFPIKNTVAGSLISDTAFITKLTPDGQSLVYSIHFANNIHPTGFALDSQGYAYLSGWTQSSTFPIVNPLQPALKGAGDLFVTKFDPTGSRIVYSTYLGGSGTNEGTALYGDTDVVADASGNAYLSGTTDSSDFPLRNAYQSTRKGPSDAFVTKLNVTGSALLFSTYLGGTSEDRGMKLAIDSAENIYVGGQTLSTDFPVSPGALQTHISCVDPGCHATGSDLFVTKLNPSGSALVFSTYLGGGGSDEVEGLNGLTVDNGGDVYLTGNTQSFNFPRTNDAVCGDEKGRPFFTRLDATGSRLTYSVCDGTEGQTGTSILVDGNHNAYASRIDLISPAFPSHVFLTKFGPAGQVLDRVQFGGQDESGDFCCIDFANDTALLDGHVVYVTGAAASNNIPNVHGFQPRNKGNGDAFITVVDFAANRFEESSSAIQYSGIWVNHPSLVHSGGSARLAVNSGARATFTFTGPTARWIAFRDQWAGIAKVYVDDVFKQEIDTYASPEMGQAVMFTVTGLGAGAHTFAVEVAGRRNPSSKGNWVWVDGFDVSTATDGTGTGNTGGGTTSFTRVEQTNLAVVFTGSWSTVHRTFFSDGSAASAAASGACATFTFQGTQARWTGFKDSYAGNVNVYIDGVLQTHIDTYSFASQANVALFTTPTLPRGTHTLRIEAAGTRNPASGANWVWVDAFEFAL